VSFRSPRSVRFAWAIAVAACCNPAIADDGAGSSLEIGGLLFGDLYTIPSHHTAAGDGASGFVLRRGYLTADFTLGADWYGRARIEINQDGDFESYGFEAEFKDLYLAREFGNNELVLGLSPTLTFDLIESVWGARYLMRTPMDLQGVASRDIGVSIKGNMSSGGRWKYRAMLSTGIEFGAESGDGRKVMGAVTWKPSESLYVDFYLDGERLAGPTDRTTLQFFAGSKTETRRWGIQYSHQDREDDPRLELASAFFVQSFRNAFSVIGRVDRILEPSPKGDNISYIPFDPAAPATMTLAGIEYRFSPVFRITPNVIWTSYDRNAEGIKPEDDLHLRLTFFLDLE
jgi:hypothetical protein